MITDVVQSEPDSIGADGSLQLWGGTAGQRMYELNNFGTTADPDGHPRWTVKFI